MQTVAELIQTLATLGVRVDRSGADLRIIADKGIVTPELMGKLRANKAEILHLLSQTSSTSAVEEAGELVADDAGLFDPFPMSDLQLAFYIANDPHMEFNVRPHLYMEFDHASFDVSRYEAAWNKALRRHRKSIAVVNSDLQVQVLREVEPIRIPIRDLRKMSPVQASDALQRTRAESMRRELPLTTWPWFELTVSMWCDEQGTERARVHYNHNSFFIDGAATNQLLAEVNSYYRDPGTTYAPLPISCRDAVHAIAQMSRSEQGKRAKEYWFSRLDELPSPPPVPTISGRSRRCRSKLVRLESVVSGSTWEAFKANATHHRITPSNAIITAYCYVLSQWSNSEHFILSQMVTRRFGHLHPAIRQILGNFASLYPLEIRLNPDVTFTANAARVQTQVLADLAHLQFGGMEVMQELNRRSGELGRAPSPFVVGSGLFMDHDLKADFCVLETSQTILDHQFFELDSGDYHYVWDYLEEFFPQGLIDSMWTAYESLFRRLAADRSAWNTVVESLVPAADLAARARRNDTHAPSNDALLHRLPAACSGSDRAFRNEQGTLTYSELDGWSDAVATELLSTGLTKGDFVMVLMDRVRELIPAVYGVLKAGGCYVPVDPSTPPERLALLLDDTKSRIVLTQERYASAFSWPAGITVISMKRALDVRQHRGLRAVDIVPSDLAYMIYTSGSTGRPKGVLIDHAGACNTIDDINRRFEVGPSDRILGVSPFNFDLSVYDIFGMMSAGACLIYPDTNRVWDPAHWLELVTQEGVSLWNSVPALMALLVSAARRARRQMPSLRLVMLSGDKIPLDLPDAIAEVAPNAQIVSLGGATEASIWSIVYPIGEVDKDWTSIPYGYPLTNQQWRICDARGIEVPVWVPGDLYIGGIGLARGYWGDVQRTHSSFVTDAAGERWYRTGDRGRYWPDGIIEFLGRNDTQIKVQGHRVELGEIEATLSMHASVRQAVVLAEAAPGKPTKLVGYVASVPGQRPTTEQLELFLRTKLPTYMVPTSWSFLDELPVTANGKIDRKRLTALRSTATTTPRSREHVAPRTVLERQLAAIWSEVLAVAEVGVNDDFFELGGQSFDAVRMFSLIKERHGKLFTLGDIWEARTVARLAEKFGGSVEQRSVVALERRNGEPPLVLVHPAGGAITAYVGLARALNRTVYGIQAKDGPQLDAIESTARHYVSELIEHIPAGTYALGGWSSGGLIAHEMAAQLEEAGREVRHVYILDCPTPHGLPPNDAQLLRYFIEDLNVGVSAHAVPADDLIGLPGADQLSKAFARLGLTSKLGSALDELVSTYAIFSKVVLAAHKHRPRMINADMTVVRAQDDAVTEFSAHPARSSDDWGWRAWTTGRVFCFVAKGNHHTLLDASAIADLVPHLLADVR